MAARLSGVRNSQKQSARQQQQRGLDAHPSRGGPAMDSSVLINLLKRYCFFAAGRPAGVFETYCKVIVFVLRAIPRGLKWLKKYYCKVIVFLLRGIPRGSQIIDKNSLFFIVFLLVFLLHIFLHKMRGPQFWKTNPRSPSVCMATC